jgi:dTMP kinase
VAVARGLFVSIEGGEGAGKTVQSRALVSHLEERDASVLYVREPGGTPLGERVRNVVLFTRDINLSPEAEALLFSAARAQLTKDVIRPALDAGTVVVADRFFDSTIAYQGFGGGASRSQLRAVTEFAVGGTVPDLTFLLDLPASLGVARAQRRSERWDRIESQDVEFHERVRQGFLTMAREEPARWIVLDATLTEEEIARRVSARVDQELTRRSHTIATRR